MNIVKLIPIPEPVEAFNPPCGKPFDPKNDVPTIQPQLIQVFEAELTLTPMNDIVRRYAFKGLRRI